MYEYPCEMTQLSPAYSEPNMQLWTSYLEDAGSDADYFNYAQQHLQQVSDFTQEMESGFTVSSGTRPFHGTPFMSPQCNTWPNDSTDFSWSQVRWMKIFGFESRN